MTTSAARAARSQARGGAEGTHAGARAAADGDAREPSGTGASSCADAAEAPTRRAGFLPVSPLTPSLALSSRPSLKKRAAAARGRKISDFRFPPPRAAQLLPNSTEMQPTLVRLKTGEIAVRVPEPAPTEAVASPRPRKTKRTPSGRPKVPPPPAPTASAEELADFEKHVWHGCFLCVIYLPRNMKRCQETIENVVGHGFPPPFMMPGVTPRPGDTVHDCVCRAHHTAISWYLAKGLDSRYHMFVLEDDAQFVFDDAAERVKVALDFRFGHRGRRPRPRAAVGADPGRC